MVKLPPPFLDVTPSDYLQKKIESYWSELVQGIKFCKFFFSIPVSILFDKELILFLSYCIDF